MYTKQTLAVATFAAAASANFMPIARRDFVEARVTDSGNDACVTALGQILPIYTEIPYPPKELLTVAVPNDPCETPDITGSLAAEYTAYTSKVLGWYSQHSAELLSALTGCSELAGYATDVPVCSTAAVVAPYPTSTESAPEETGYASSGSDSGSSGSSGSSSGESSGSSGSSGSSSSESGDDSSSGSDESSGSGSDESSGSGSDESSGSGSDESSGSSSGSDASAGSTSGSGSDESSSGSDESSGSTSGSGSDESSGSGADSSDSGADAGAGAGAEETPSAAAGAEPTVTGFDYSSSTATDSAKPTYATAAAARETGFAAGIIAAAGLAVAVAVL